MKIIYKILRKTSALLIKISNLIYKSSEKIREDRARPWFDAGGDKSLRLNYNELNDNSLLFDVGGYKGDWVSDIFSKYLCNVYVFEPVKKFSDEILLRFKNNDKIKVFNFGLEGRDCDLEINLDNDSSSIFKESKEKEKIKIKNISNFIKDNNIETIDLMKINIEGGEYDLLESLIKNDLIKIIKNIQVQFHDFVPLAKERMENIQRKISKSHVLTYQYLYVWENWKLK